MTRERDGSYAFTAVHESWCVIDPEAFVEAATLRAEIEARLRPELLVPPAGDSNAAEVAEQRAAERLEDRAAVRAELAALCAELERGEIVIDFAQAMCGLEPGLLALTDRRMLFVSVDDEPTATDIRHHRVNAVTRKRGPRGAQLRLDASGESVTFWRIRPRGRAAQLEFAMRACLNR